jgi:hypothetical protein
MYKASTCLAECTGLGERGKRGNHLAVLGWGMEPVTKQQQKSMLFLAYSFAMVSNQQESKRQRGRTIRLESVYISRAFKF